jgi:hypothetical protein
MLVHITPHTEKSGGQACGSLKCHEKAGRQECHTRYAAAQKAYPLLAAQRQPTEASGFTRKNVYIYTAIASSGSGPDC